MISHEFEYVKPASLPDALAALAEDGSKALSGGMSLIPMMKLRLAMPSKLVDLSGISGLSGIEKSGDSLVIGALTTHYEVESSAVVRQHCPLLAAAAAAIGDVQVRNMGTIGGSIAHNDPAADYPAALLALDAKVRLASKSGTREMAIADFLVETLSTALEPGEIVTHIVVPADPAGSGACYRKVPHPASGYAVVGIAVRLPKGGKAAVAVTGLSSKAFRASAVEAALNGGASAEDAASHVTDGIEAAADVYASAEYRSHLARVQTARAIAAASK